MNESISQSINLETENIETMTVMQAKFCENLGWEQLASKNVLGREEETVAIGAPASFLNACSGPEVLVFMPSLRQMKR